MIPSKLGAILDFFRLRLKRLLAFIVGMKIRVESSDLRQQKANKAINVYRKLAFGHPRGVNVSLFKVLPCANGWRRS